MNAQFRETLKVHAGIADSVLDKLFLRLAALPDPWTLVATVAAVVAIFAAGVMVGRP